MFDISLELNKIIDKYNLDACYPLYKDSIMAKKLILQYAKENSEKKILCVSTSSWEVERFKWDCEVILDAEYITILPSESGKYSFEGFLSGEVLDRIDYNKFDFVLIISIYGEAFLKRYFRRHNIKHESIYDFFGVNGLFIDREYYSFFEDRSYGTLVENPVRKQNSVLSPLPYERFRLKKECEASTDRNYRELCLKKLFFLAILERDFAGLKEIFEEFKTISIDSLNTYYYAYGEVLALLEKIKNVISIKKEKIIAALWIDAVSYQDIEGWDYLNKKRNSGIWFTNMHTVTPYTNQTMRAIMCESLPVDNESMSIKHIDDSNSPLINTLGEKGYSFMSMDGDFTVIDMKYRVKELCELYTPFSMKIWEMLRKICKKDTKQFFLVHELMETHMPYITHLVEDDDIGQSQKRKKYGLEAIEKQLKFFDKIVGKKAIKILFSDHGNSNFTTRFHTFFFIEGGGVPAKTIGGLVSINEFRKIVDMLVENNDVDENRIVKDELTIQDIPYYNGRAIGNLIENGSISSGNMGYRGIIDKDYYYAYFSNGMQWLCSRKSGEPKMNPNLLFDVAFDTRLLGKYKGKLKGKKMPTVGEEAGGYTKYIGRAINHPDTVKRQTLKRKVTIELVEKLPEKNVAIRTGGVHSYTFLSIIATLGKLYKIGYIIDIDKSCQCKEFGIPVITPEEAKDFDISALIKGYFDLDIPLRKEYDGYRDRGIEVIDIYAALSEKGIRIRSGFNFFDLDFLCDTKSIGFPKEEVGM